MIDCGSYRILLEVNFNISIMVGALGEIPFKNGYYIYSGSAMGNLRSRVNRHLSKEKKLRWHIDYLLLNESVEILKIIEYPSLIKEECKLNIELITFQDSYIPVKGFGSSDCKICPSHLIGFKKLPLEFERFVIK